MLNQLKSSFYDFIVVIIVIEINKFIISNSFDLTKSFKFRVLNM